MEDFNSRTYVICKDYSLNKIERIKSNIKTLTFDILVLGLGLATFGYFTNKRLTKLESTIDNTTKGE